MPDIEHGQLLPQRCRELKSKRWLTKVAKLQTVADSHDPKGFYQTIRAVWGPKVDHPEQLRVFDNKTVITEKRRLGARWKNHFGTLLNELSTMEQHAVDNRTLDL